MTALLSPPTGRRRPLAIVAALSATLLALAGCATATASDTKTDAATPVYRIGISDPGAELDPLTVADGDAQLITGLVTEQLVSFTADGEALPRLATAWEASDDGLTWTITLRDGATFNDGDPVTADDVVATFDAIIGEDSISPAKSAFAGILDTVAATDDSTVTFALARPFSDFPRLLAGSNTGILPADYEPGTWLDNPVGAGQFLLEDYEVGQSVTYVKNPDYWNADQIDLDGVELKIYKDPQAIVLAFQAGEIDRITVSPEVLATVNVDDYDTLSAGYSHFYGVHLNVTKPPFDDETIRQALAWAIDRDAIVDLVFGGTASVGNDFPVLPDYLPQPVGIEQRKQDLDKVAELLDGRTVSFTITTSFQLYGEVLQQQLNAIDGFDVKLEVLSDEQYYAEGDDSPWLNAPLTITSWGKRVPSQYYGLFYADGAAWNAAHYANPALGALVADFDATTDDAEREKLLTEISQTEWTDVPTIIPALVRSEVLQNKRVRGEFIAPIDFWSGYNFAGISIASE
ncbi:ABC transporter substrate-binding protein [Microbacterium oxydans]|jgi:peptide/nickel transport system substrate-binding protein|uniref:ABC transporter substrate-binding protein n=1 Tax=Microbacterium oxydans TaxID=82380 RepID=UPI00226B39FD|nr:ABC transporter substrate-binding protein [Microbacterium oxydans]WAA65501.1 ABC transporter substrate-binding protein [Microbacterium oxydans]